MWMFNFVLWIELINKIEENIILGKRKVYYELKGYELQYVRNSLNRIYENLYIFDKNNRNI